MEWEVKRSEGRGCSNAEMVVVAGSDWRCFQQQTEMGMKETNVGEPEHRVKGAG